MGKLPAYVILFFLFLLGVYNGFGQDKTKDVLNSLDSAIAHRQDFLNKKLQLIDKLKYSVPDKNNLAETYDYYLNLYKQYQSFKFDSAFYYVRKLNETARQTNNAELITSAKIEFSNILITAGIFSESLDTLNILTPIKS